jgi:hypothetical protein
MLYDPRMRRKAPSAAGWTNPSTGSVLYRPTDPPADKMHGGMTAFPELPAARLFWPSCEVKRPVGAALGRVRPAGLP